MLLFTPLPPHSNTISVIRNLAAAFRSHNFFAAIEQATVYSTISNSRHISVTRAPQLSRYITRVSYFMRAGSSRQGQATRRSSCNLCDQCHPHHLRDGWMDDELLWNAALEGRPGAPRFGASQLVVGYGEERRLAWSSIWHFG